MNSNEMTQALSAPFSDAEVKRRPGRGGKHFRYVDARTVARRLTDVLGLTGWSFETSVADAERQVVHGKLTVILDGVTIVRSDFGYPNSDTDDEPLKSAASDALKRAAVQLGVGAYLYGDETSQAAIAAEREKLAKINAQFSDVMEAIRAMNAEEAERIESGLAKWGATSLNQLPLAKAEWARDRALSIMDKVIAEANAADGVR